MKTLKDWYIVKLTDYMLVGRLFGGKEIQVNRVVGVDLTNNYVVSEYETYKLSNADKVWIETHSAKEYLKELSL